jgi:Ca2+-binding RTX toxin-like protein
MAVQIQLRRDTAANWTSANPTLALGELGMETDTMLYKIGDGTTAWNSQAYAELAGTDKFTINEQTGTAYTLVGGDAGKLLKMNNAAATVLTVPPNSSVAFDIGVTVTVVNYGAGQVTLTAGAGVTIYSYNAALNITGQYGQAVLTKCDTDLWVAAGLLS